MRNVQVFVYRQSLVYKFYFLYHLEEQLLGFILIGCPRSRFSCFWFLCVICETITIDNCVKAYVIWCRYFSLKNYVMRWLSDKSIRFCFLETNFLFVGSKCYHIWLLACVLTMSKTYNNTDKCSNNRPLCFLVLELLIMYVWYVEEGVGRGFSTTVSCDFFPF